MSQTPPSPGPSDDDLEAYLGLDAASAEERARARGWTTVRTLPPGAIITMEYLVGRINFTVEDGKVARCWPG
jgi:Peptidase inhibitor I78 family